MTTWNIWWQLEGPNACNAGMPLPWRKPVSQHIITNFNNRRVRKTSWQLAAPDNFIVWNFLFSGYDHLSLSGTTKITLLRVIPTMTFIHFVTGKSSGILSDISSGILSGLSSGILSTQIFWHSIWQTFWHFIWHIFWHSIWHLIWHSIWHTFWHSIWHIFKHSIWHISWHSIWHILWRFIWHIFWHSIWLLRSSGAHWARKAPGWGPAVRTELGRSQVEVQRCALSWEGPRLRSSGAHWAWKVPGWGPAVRTELGRSQFEVHQCALSSEVGEELGEELARRKWRWKLMQTWSRRKWRRRRRMRKRRRRRRTTALIKSNNPHLAGGEKYVMYQHS